MEHRFNNIKNPLILSSFDNVEDLLMEMNENYLGWIFVTDNKGFNGIFNAKEYINGGKDIMVKYEYGKLNINKSDIESENFINIEERNNMTILIIKSDVVCNLEIVGESPGRIRWYKNGKLEESLITNFKKFEAVKWYKGGQFIEDDTWVNNIEPKLKFMTFESIGSIESVYILEEIIKNGDIIIYNDYKYVPYKRPTYYRLLTQTEIEKYVYSNDIPIEILYEHSHNVLYYYKDLPQELKNLL